MDLKMEEMVVGGALTHYWNDYKSGKSNIVEDILEAYPRYKEWKNFKKLKILNSEKDEVNFARNYVGVTEDTYNTSGKIIEFVEKYGYKMSYFSGFIGKKDLFFFKNFYEKMEQIEPLEKDFDITLDFFSSALKAYNFQFIDFLIETGFNMNMIDNDGWSIMMRLVEMGINPTGLVTRGANIGYVNHRIKEVRIYKYANFDITKPFDVIDVINYFGRHYNVGLVNPSEIRLVILSRLSTFQVERCKMINGVLSGHFSNLLIRMILEKDINKRLIWKDIESKVFCFEC